MLLLFAFLQYNMPSWCQILVQKEEAPLACLEQRPFTFVGHLSSVVCLFKCSRKSKEGDLTHSAAYCCFLSLTILGNNSDKQNSLEFGFKLCGLKFLASVPTTIARLTNFAPSSVWLFHPWCERY